MTTSTQRQLRRGTTAQIAAMTPAAGEAVFDTAMNMIAVGDGSTPGGLCLPKALSAQNGGDTNNSSSGSGSFHDHSLTYTIPANYLVANKVLRVTAMVSVTTGAASPTLTARLKAGSTVIYQQNGTGTPTANSTGVNLALVFYIHGTAAAGGSSSVHTTPVNAPQGINAAANFNSVAQPVSLATNGTLALIFGTEWGSAGTGTNTVTLNTLVVESLN